MTEQQNTENEVIVTIKSINYSGKWMEFWFEEDFNEGNCLSFQFSCKTYKFWELIDNIEHLRQNIDISGVKGLKIKLKYTSPNWDIVEIIQKQSMNNQQKQLQSILAEVGINLTENQTLAVMEANELLKCGDPSYSQVMEFKEKYAPKRQKQDGIHIKGQTPYSFGWDTCHSKHPNDDSINQGNEVTV